MAPVEMRGRYMGFYGLTWGASFGIGPLVGGLILSAGDGEYRRYLWYGAIVAGGIGALAFLALGRYLKRHTAKVRWAELMARYSPDAAESMAPNYDSAASGSPVLPGNKSQAD
jgi:MFS family permease